MKEMIHGTRKKYYQKHNKTRRNKQWNKWSTVRKKCWKYDTTRRHGINIKSNDWQARNITVTMTTHEQHKDFLLNHRIKNKSVKLYQDLLLPFGNIATERYQTSARRTYKTTFCCQRSSKHQPYVFDVNISTANHGNTFTS